MPQYSAIRCVGSNAIPMQEARHSKKETIGMSGYNGV
jgi:hypothetical protein